VPATSLGTETGRRRRPRLVRVVERRVEIPVPTTQSSPRHGAWARLLGQLADELDGFGVYDRDLPGLTGALQEVQAALGRRATRRR